MRAPSVPVTAPPASTGPFDADAYAGRLRRDPQGVNDPDWRVDWADGPWPVKVYTGAERTPLGRTSALDRVLWYTAGITLARFDPSGGLPATPGNPAPVHLGGRYGTRRPVPSGGAMYPTELYVVDTRQARVTHYDPYRHELTELRHPAACVAVRAALGRPPECALPPYLLVLTHRFWKNFYKYGDFATRLGAVDAGVLLGRAVRLGVAGFADARVHLDFDDVALAGLLGVDVEDEAPYAVLGLGPATVCPGEPGGVPGSGPVPPATVEKSRRIKRSARLRAMQAAAREPAPASVPGAGEPDAGDGPVVDLDPGLPVDLLDPDGMLRRASSGRRFTGAAVPSAALATVLAHTAESVAAVHACAHGAFGPDVEVYCAVQRVTGVPSGWYRYRPASGQLAGVGTGAAADCGRHVQRALFAESLNAELAAFTVHAVAPLDFRASGRGVRGYREQQLAVGACVEAVSLAAHAAGLSGHAVLGYDVEVIDRAYGLLGGDRGTHAQVSVGVVAPSTNWEIEVRPR